MNEAISVNYITQAIQLIGAKEIAHACGLGARAVHKWARVGRLPYTEYTGETAYAEKIEKLTGGLITKSQLLSMRGRANPVPVPNETSAPVQ